MRLAVFLLALASAVVVGCSPGGSALLSDVQIGPSQKSPDLRDARNRISVAYHLAAPARVSASVQASDGREWPVYADELRPRAGDYRLDLDGTVPGPGAGERQALPSGEYRVILRAETDGHDDERQLPFTLTLVDAERPRIENLVVFPDRISPNFDARDDVARMTYRVTKAGQVTPFADRVAPDGQRTRAWTGETLTVEAGEQGLVWDAVVGNRPLADGTYELGIEARDDVGNVTRAVKPLTIEAGGVPEAKIVWARIAPNEIIRGGEVCADITVRNVGQTVLRSQGPDPGYVYNSFDSYSSIEDHTLSERAGYWRVGLDWAGAPDTGGARYPYRWGFGKDLQPGEETTVHGCVQINHEQTKMIFFAALIRENVSIQESGTALTEIRITP